MFVDKVLMGGEHEGNNVFCDVESDEEKSRTTIFGFKVRRTKDTYM